MISAYHFLKIFEKFMHFCRILLIWKSFLHKIRVGTFVNNGYHNPVIIFLLPFIYVVPVL